GALPGEGARVDAPSVADCVRDPFGDLTTLSRLEVRAHQRRSEIALQLRILEEEPEESALRHVIRRGPCAPARARRRALRARTSVRRARATATARGDRRHHLEDAFLLHAESLGDVTDQHRPAHRIAHTEERRNETTERLLPCLGGFRTPESE